MYIHTYVCMYKFQYESNYGNTNNYKNNCGFRRPIVRSLQLSTIISSLPVTVIEMGEAYSPSITCRSCEIENTKYERLPKI